MASGFTNGTVNVSGSVTSTASKNTATFASSGTNAATLIAAVPAGKVARILSVWLSCTYTTGASNCSVNLNGSAALTLNALGIATYGNGLASQALTFDYGACPVLTAGQTATFSSSLGAGINYGGVVYVLEDA